MPLKTTVGVIGSGKPISPELFQLAYDVGMYCAQRSAVLVCGGLGGIMEAASKGAADHGGIVVGFLPGNDKTEANPHVSIAIPTGLGAARNALVAAAADAVIAFPGAFGTLSEMALALEKGKSVIYLPGSWDLKKAGPLEAARCIEAFDARQAVGLALGEIGKQQR